MTNHAITLTGKEVWQVAAALLLMAGQKQPHDASSCLSYDLLCFRLENKNNFKVSDVHGVQSARKSQACTLALIDYRFRTAGPGLTAFLDNANFPTDPTADGHAGTCISCSRLVGMRLCFSQRRKNNTPDTHSSSLICTIKHIQRSCHLDWLQTLHAQSHCFGSPWHITNYL